MWSSNLYSSLRGKRNVEFLFLFVAYLSELAADPNNKMCCANPWYKGFSLSQKRLASFQLTIIYWFFIFRMMSKERLFAFSNINKVVMIQGFLFKSLLQSMPFKKYWIRKNIHTGIIHLWELFGNYHMTRSLRITLWC